jgi:thiol-disulfide isomerase/thioredoxin
VEHLSRTDRSPGQSGGIPAAIALGAIGLGALFCAAACRGAVEDPSATPASSQATVSVEFADLDALRGALAARRGQRVLLNFWATWCVPCVEELPDLVAFAGEHAGKDAGLIGVSLDAWVTGEGAETEEKVKKALADVGAGYANFIYRGDQDPLLEAFGLPGPIPYSILYDRDGREIRRWEGEVDIPDLRQTLAASP